ncbi:MAG: nucleoside kinase [Bacteroidota bacterium]|nr:nucleoside kinase [Bacteroidota bacterium]
MEETHLRQRRQTVKLGLIKIVGELFPEDQLKTAYSIQNGVFCRLAKSVLSIREVKLISFRLNEWVENNSPIEFLSKKDGYFHYKLGTTIVRAVYPANTYTSMVEPFRIIPFSTGFIVDFSIGSGEDEMPLIMPQKLSATYEKTQLWLRNIGIELIPDINAYITSGKSIELISIAEAMQEKEISDIADMILKSYHTVRIVLISGPSSSGKTTFAQRISTQLKVNGLRPIPLSLDNYFVNRDQTPRDSQGNYDFESLEALDLNLLQTHLTKLINGETVDTPIFDFVVGARSDETITMNLGPTDILVIEGIHALNPNLLPVIQRNVLFKIYISALFELNVDFMNRIPTTEVRLIRRMVRGVRFRGTPPEDTLEQWENVRKGEYENIFKYEEESDAMFNSSLLYEMNALKPFAEEALHKISDESPFFDTKERLLNLLTFFKPLDVSKVPFNSILREFIGGSIYFDDK